MIREFVDNYMEGYYNSKHRMIGSSIFKDPSLAKSNAK